MPRAVLRRPEATGSAEGGSYSTRSGLRKQMSASLRMLTFSAGALLWISGVAWLVLHYGFAQRTAFGPLPNPWEPTVMRVHGLLAVAGVFLLGWITAGHMSERWRSRPRRISGLLLAASGAILIMSGYALYYTTGSPHEVAALAHEVLGAAALIVALAHWWRRRTVR
jgi:hypothetical protein